MTGRRIVAVGLFTCVAVLAACSSFGDGQRGSGAIEIDDVVIDY